jgi:starch-binding outer membrane protein, SusD/RagB family
MVDVKLMRSAEMHLIRAEARASNNDLPGAAADINALRSARIEGYTNVTFANQQDAINAIMNERAKELCYEGFRFYDMQRRRISVQRLASDVQSTLWQNLPSDNFRFVMPIPNQSILSNPNMVQNPGY